MFIVRGLLLKYMNRRSELMSAVSMNEAAKKTAQLENAKEARPPGGAPQEEHLPRKIFVCSPYRPTSQDEKCRKDELEANIRRAKMACRILSTLGFLPLAPHLYFTQFLKDEEKQERNTGILGEYVVKPPGKLALVPDSDPREAVDLQTAEDEFAVLD